MPPLLPHPPRIWIRFCIISKWMCVNLSLQRRAHKHIGVLWDFTPHALCRDKQTLVLQKLHNTSRCEWVIDALKEATNIFRGGFNLLEVDVFRFLQCLNIFLSRANNSKCCWACWALDSAPGSEQQPPEQLQTFVWQGSLKRRESGIWDTSDPRHCSVIRGTAPTLLRVSIAGTPLWVLQPVHAPTGAL